jgi:hypothetical protein
MMSAEAAWRSMSLAGGWFVILFVSQLLLWRHFKPRRQILALFALYFSPAAFLLLFAPPAGVFLLGLSFAYVMTFPAIQAESPTLRLIRLLRENGGEMAESELIRLLGEGSILDDRKRDLASDGLIGEKGELGLAGRGLALFFRAYRRMAGLKEGNG